MKDKYKGTGSGLCIFVVALVIAVTIFYKHRDDIGYKFTHYYYVHDSGIIEYSSSSLSAFPISGDYSNLIDRDVYYYDESNTLKRDRLISISLPAGKFVVSDGEHDTKKFLGQPTGGVPMVGSLLDFLTDNTFYVIMVLLPGGLCVVYVLYSFIMSFVDDKKKKKK